MPLLLEFSLGYAHQDGFKLNGTHQLLVYADGANSLGKGMHATQKITEDSLLPVEVSEP